MDRKEQKIAVFKDTMDWIGHEPAGSHSRAPTPSPRSRRSK